MTYSVALSREPDGRYAIPDALDNVRDAGLTVEEFGRLLR